MGAAALALVLTGCGAGENGASQRAESQGPASAAESAGASSAASSGETSPQAKAVVDWKALTFPVAHCTSREEWVDTAGSAQSWDEVQPVLSEADVTGDGVPETIAVVQCPASTSSWPQVFTVWDTTADEPRPLLVSDDLYFRDAALVPGQREVTISGPYVGESDANCCAGHWAQLTYRWAKDRFKQVENISIVNDEDPTSGQGTGQAPTVQLSHDALADGVSYGIVRGTSTTTTENTKPTGVVVDVIEYLTGEQAQQACAADDPDAQAAGMCGDVFIRNDNPLLRAAPLAPSAEVQALGEDLQLRPLDPAQLASENPTGGTVSSPYWEIETHGGQVTRLTQLYMP